MPVLLDTTLRDGSYAVDFQFTAEDTALIVSALEYAGVRYIEVGHGQGLGAARAGHGEPASTDHEYLAAARKALDAATFGPFFIPGIGTEDDLRLARDEGAGFVRIGTDITKLHEAGPFIACARSLGLTVFSNLMKSYAVDAKSFGGCARTASEMGAEIVYLVDSAGGMLPEDVAAYISSAREATTQPLGFHGHNNLSMAVANTLSAFDHGAEYLDASLQGIGRSEGNCVLEILAAILHRRGAIEDIDINGLLDVSEAFIRPLLRSGGYSGLGITSGRAHFHSSFLSNVIQTAREFSVDARELILALRGHDTVHPPPELVQQFAKSLSERDPKAQPQISIVHAAPSATDLLSQTIARVRELREKARKLDMHSVLNIVLGPYEPEHVSPFVQTNFGCAISNVMLSDAEQLDVIFENVDGIVDFILIDASGHSVPSGHLSKTVLLPYSDAGMWCRAVVAHLSALMGDSLNEKHMLILGIPELSARVASSLAELGVHVEVHIPGGQNPPILEKTAPVSFVESPDAYCASADAVIALSPRLPAITESHVAHMREGALLYDGGIGSLTPEAQILAAESGIRVVRVDLRPTLAATALELIHMRQLVRSDMGVDTWSGVEVVAGGLLGRDGQIVVDSIDRPSHVIGVADGKGGIREADASDASVRSVSEAIAQKRLKRGMF